MKVCLACEKPFDGDGWRCPNCGHSPVECDGHLAFSPALAEINDSFNPEGFALLAPLEGKHFWFRSRNRLVFWVLRRYFSHARSLLEVGCGTGFVLSGIQQEFPDLKLTGSEIFSQALAFAGKRLPGIELFQMDACHIPFEREFDVIGAFDVLEHIEEDEMVLVQMYKATKPGGGIILTVPQHPFLWSQVDDYSFHKRRYTRKALVKKLNRAGFSVVRVTSFVFALLPALMLSRLKRQGLAGSLDPLEELEIDQRLSRALERLLSIELRLIERGVSFPAGGSLLAVARREAR